MAEYEYIVLAVGGEHYGGEDFEAELAQEVSFMEANSESPPYQWECLDGVELSFYGGPYGDRNVRLEQAMRKQLEPGEIAMPHPHYADGTPVGR